MLFCTHNAYTWKKYKVSACLIAFQSYFQFLLDIIFSYSAKKIVELVYKPTHIYNITRLSPQKVATTVVAPEKETHVNIMQTMNERGLVMAVQLFLHISSLQVSLCANFLVAECHCHCFYTLSTHGLHHPLF